MAHNKGTGKVVSGYQPSAQTRARLAKEEAERRQRERKARKPAGPAWTIERLRESPPKTRHALFRAVGSVLGLPGLADFMRRNPHAGALERYLRAGLFDSALLEVFLHGRRDWDEFGRAPYQILRQSASPSERKRLEEEEDRAGRRRLGYYGARSLWRPDADPVQRVHGDTVSDAFTWARRAAGGRPAKLSAPFDVHIEPKAELFRSLLGMKDDPRSLGGRVLMFDDPNGTAPVEAWAHLALEVDLNGQPARLNVWYPLSKGQRTGVKPEELLSVRWVQNAKLPVFTCYQRRVAFLTEARANGELAVEIDRPAPSPKARSIDDLLGPEQVCRHERATWHGNQPWVAYYFRREWDWEKRAYTSDPRAGSDSGELRCPTCLRQNLAWARRHQFPPGHPFALSTEDEEWYGLSPAREIEGPSGSDFARGLFWGTRVRGHFGSTPRPQKRG